MSTRAAPRGRWTAVLVVSLFVVTLHSFFLDQAFHIDDRVYLQIARQVSEAPLFPQDFSGVFFGQPLPDFASHTHPPGISYLLAAGIALLGEQETRLHSLFLVFPLVAAGAVYSLAGKFTRFRTAAAMLFSALPGIFVMSHTLMTDVPFTALWLAATAAFVRYLDSAKAGWSVLCGMCLAMASMVNYLAPLISVLLFLYLVWRHERQSKAIVLLVPLVVIGAWLLVSSVHYGRFILAHTTGYLQAEGALSTARVSEKLLYWLLALGGTSVPLILIALLVRRIQRRVLLVAGFAAWLVLAWLHWGRQWTDRALFVLFFATGLWIVWEMVRLGHGWRSRSAEEKLLVVWFFGFSAVVVMVYSFGAVRYLLPIFAPVVFVFLMQSERRVSAGVPRRYFSAAAVVLTAAVAFSLAAADYQFAGIYPQMAVEVARLHDFRPGRVLWFSGEWGFRYYLERQGARPLRRAGTGPGPGDLLIKPLLFPYVTLYDREPQSRLLERRPYPIRMPVRILDVGRQAGFYSSAWGILPFSLGDRHEPVEIFNIFRIEKRFEGDAQGVERPYFTR